MIKYSQSTNKFSAFDGKHSDFSEDELWWAGTRRGFESTPKICKGEPGRRASMSSAVRTNKAIGNNRSLEIVSGIQSGICVGRRGSYCDRKVWAKTMWSTWQFSSTHPWSVLLMLSNQNLSQHHNQGRRNNWDRDTVLRVGDNPIWFKRWNPVWDRTP